MIPEDPNNELPPNLSDTIGFIGSVIVTFGYIIGTLGEGIALSEAARAEQKDKQAGLEQQQQMKQIQSKLDYLVHEMETLKKKKR
ncbi:hypothetical protein MHB48_00990 [Psychrobacillus sp. FSL H8-0483]|uniref:hypothetical protein n=1 Tax=Psychrobacillus sp. FSL H8-0483 TaxID=2921389 RepID=UPI003159FDCA